MTETTGYLQRWRNREQLTALRNQASFGIIGGTILVILFGFRFFYGTRGPDWLWGTLALAGILLIIVGLARPAALAPLEANFRKFANYLGKFVFQILLAAIYFLLLTPTGLLQKKLRGSAPFYYWDGSPPASHEGWTDKSLALETNALKADGKGRPLLFQPFFVFRYFIQYRHFILLPILFVLVIVGLLMYFVAASVLAPFIYTLF